MIILSYYYNYDSFSKRFAWIEEQKLI